MAGQSIRNEFLEFVEFAAAKITRDESMSSVEELLHQWRRERERAAVVDDVRQGLLDIAAGKGESIQDVMASIRLKLGLPA